MKKKPVKETPPPPAVPMLAGVDDLNPYPYNPRWPPDPAVFLPGKAYDTMPDGSLKERVE